MEKKKESRSGMEIMNLLQVYFNYINVLQIIDHSSHLMAFMIYDMSRKKGDNGEHGMARRLIMISIKR